MKKVNFKELNVETSIDKFEKLDLRKEIGNAIHQKAVTVPMSELARSIYHSDEPVKMSDEDCVEMLSIIEKSFARLVFTAAKKCVINVENKESND